MYSHPLEAVQAISMFNGQILYGMKLKVTMINPPGDTIVLPKGLKDVGPGLGFNGRPLRDIVKHYKKYTKHQLSLVDASLFCRQNDNDEDEKELLDSKNTELDEKSKDSEENSDESSRRKYFKITNVEDLPVKDKSQDSSHNTSDMETQSKKPRRDEPDAASSSDEESADARIVSNFKAKLKGNEKTSENEKSKDPRPGANAIQTIGSNIRPFSNSVTQNFQPPMSQPMGLQFRPNPPIGNAFPSGPMGSSAPVGPFQPSGPPMAPVGPNGPMMAPTGLNGPMMAPGPNGPMMPPVGASGPMAPLRPNGPMGPFGPPTGPVGPPAGMINTMGPSGPFGSFRPPGPNVPPAMPGPNPGLGPPMIRGNGPNTSGPSQPMPNDVITLQFRNLPPSTTFPLLCDKVSQCGQVLSLQLTTPGCAVARFAHRVHAERCFQFFNGKCIDGCVIEVRFA
ncbi:hypothetical protein ABMA27_005380 [Loxostege sticticalis]|uniref:RRM domain-containing protein n=1 Tax=Loxostege sticticalis TaxID=481309 RepID=A0ABR3HIY9_LOXSC